ncbi:LAME_0H00210g1_1 [Lachancea meyersii CBS 8951]|uniref:LAME_0H00210g1_1 n=1 Tax=Lachancea meyersii CBS 8951 TaxID=1266667 RepID=A0A1G4KD79_9SACH|nr:LAME_0H00210g1_1 [Lachancea meyersii CBS 8951]
MTLSLSKIWNSKFVQLVVSQWFFIALVCFIVLARFVPNFARQGGLVKAEYTIEYGAVALIFLQNGLSMSTKKLCVYLSNWRAHIVILLMSFLITSSIIFGFCCAIQRSGNSNIDEWLLVGLILTAASPTTVASNVVMTQEAKGNDLLCLCEVFIGNFLGGFITPAIVQMYLSTSLFAFGNPSNGSSVRTVYANVMKQIGLSVLVPLFVGQLAQNLFPKQVSWALKALRMNKVGSVCLLLVMFSSFSTAFYQHAFTSVPGICIVFVVLFNLGIYLFFSVLCFVCARPWIILRLFPEEPSESSSKPYIIGYRLLRPFYYNKKDTVAILFCGPAKTAALGVSLISSQYGSDFPQLGKLLVPLVLYQSEQVVTAKLLVPWVRRWAAEENDQASGCESDLEQVSSTKSGEHVDGTDSYERAGATSENATTGINVQDTRQDV